MGRTHHPPTRRAGIAYPRRIAGPPDIIAMNGEIWESVAMSSTSGVRALLADFSIEATPKQLASVPLLAELLPPWCSIYVPFLPGADFVDAEAACKQIAAAGFRPVPHLPARRFEDRVQLAGWLARFQGAGADSLLLIAGDVSSPKGPFADTLAVLDSGLLERHGFHRIGVAGHPEGHPIVSEAELTRALAHKSDYARDTGADMWLVTQFVFSADPVCHWLDRLDAAGFTLPVRVGLPGPASTRTLISYAVQCGVKVSTRMLTRRPGMARKLLGRWHPNDLLLALARYHTEAHHGLLSGVHVYPFGGLQRSADWFSGMLDHGTDES